MEIAETVSPYFDKVYVTGHPAMSVDLKSRGNIEVCLTTDNSKILEYCANSQLIITMHSGTVYLGDYTNSQILIIYKGKPPIGSLQNTLRFKPFLGKKYDFKYAFSLNEISTFVKQYK